MGGLTDLYRTWPFFATVIDNAEMILAKADRGVARMYAALATLLELHRSVIAQRYLEEMDYASIEQTLGLSNGALRGILGRALAAMRKRLKTNTEVFS